MYSEQELIDLTKKLAGDELRRIQYWYKMGFTETEILQMHKKNEAIIEHDQRPAVKVNNYRAQIEYDYYGWGAKLYRNLWRH